jgi:hypothetical protein
MNKSTLNFLIFLHCLIKIFSILPFNSFNFVYGCKVIIQAIRLHTELGVLKKGHVTFHQHSVDKNRLSHIKTALLPSD